MWESNQVQESTKNSDFVINRLFLKYIYAVYHPNLVAIEKSNGWFLHNNYNTIVKLCCWSSF